MNKEVLEMNNKECYVIEHNGKIRRITRDNEKGDMKDILVMENKIEKLENEKKELVAEKPISQSSILSVVAFIFFVFITMFVGVTSFSSVFSLEAYAHIYFKAMGIALGLVGVSSTIMLLCVNAYRKSKKKKCIATITNRINDLKKSLSVMKENEKINEEVLVNAEIDDEAALEIESINDEECSRLFEKNNYKVLRQTYAEYLEEKNIDKPEEKGFTYTLRR